MNQAVRPTPTSRVIDLLEPARVRENSRDRLVREHLPFARSLAKRYAGRGEHFDDLYQVACLGLVKAAGRFDTERGVMFKTYAQAVILGEIKRHFRDHSWGLRVARPVQELFLVVRDARERLTQELGHAPTMAQLAAAARCTEEEAIEAVRAGDTFYLQSMDAPIKDDQGDLSGGIDIGFVETAYGQVEERSWLVPAIESLSERDRRILEMRFFEGLSQSKIAARLGLSQMHVSRLLARALAKLRAAAERAERAPLEDCG